MAYFVRTVMPSGTLARRATSYDKLEDAMSAAGAEIRQGYAIDAWIEDGEGDLAADLSKIKQHCGIS
jgi:hypothetical protein